MGALIIAVFCLVFYEWFKMVINSNFSVLSKLIWFFIGLTYIAIAFRNFWTFSLQPGGNHLLMTILVLVWASDTGGYLFGMTLKGPKFAPAISPNKTWSGVAGGFILTWIVAHIIFTFTVHFTLHDLYKSALIAFSISILAQFGDFLESWVKRQFNVKDTSNLIPGHGGFMDRLDGVIAVGFALSISKFYGYEIAKILGG